jgi:hypothetical protein
VLDSESVADAPASARGGKIAAKRCKHIAQGEAKLCERNSAPQCCDAIDSYQSAIANQQPTIGKAIGN